MILSENSKKTTNKQKAKKKNEIERTRVAFGWRRVADAWAESNKHDRESIKIPNAPDIREYHSRARIRRLSTVKLDLIFAFSIYTVI